MGKVERIQVPSEDRERLGKLVKDRNTPQEIGWRSQIVLLAADGIGATEVAARVGKSLPTVRRWRRRYAAKGLEGLLKDATRPPGRMPLTARKIEEVAGLALKRKLSHDPNFIAKVEDVVGLEPANKALVLSGDEKSQIQATLLHRHPRLDAVEGPLHTVESIPSSIGLSPVQREILKLIIQHQASVQGSAEPERVILLWSEGVSESTTAQKLGVTEEEVKTLRYRWWVSTMRIAASERKWHKALSDFVSLIFRVPNEKTPSETALYSSEGSAQTSSNQGTPAEHKGLRPAARALIEILHHKPNVYGINRSNWTQESLAVAFDKLYGQRPSGPTVGRLLKQAGLSWNTSHRVLTSPDPHYREKVELLLKTLQSLKFAEDLFFIDELGPLQVKRYGGRSYTTKAAMPTHPQYQHSRGSITLYGALSATTNQVTWFYGNSKDTARIIDLAEILFNQCHAKSKIYLTWDAASWHRSDELVRWADTLNVQSKASGTGPIIEFVPLPSSAQFLNVIEAVFSGMKRAVIHNSDYQSEEEMKTAISTHFCERNEFFKQNPRRAGKKIWEIDFFQDHNNIRSGNYREW